MIERYPHTAKIEVTREVDNGTGIPSIETETFEVVGRYEPAGANKNLDYSAKFYCPKMDIDVTTLSGGRFFFQNRFIGISEAWNYQTHCEIWLD